MIPGRVLAEYVREHAAPVPDPLATASSARNRFVGLVTRVIADGVMAEVEMQCGPHTVVSPDEQAFADQLGLRGRHGGGRGGRRRP